MRDQRRTRSHQVRIFAQQSIECVHVARDYGFHGRFEFRDRRIFLGDRLHPFRKPLPALETVPAGNGELSALWLRRIGEVTAKSVPHGEAAKIQGSRHFPHIENPSEFNSKVLGFISKR